jgi:hypothetical protein
LQNLFVQALLAKYQIIQVLPADDREEVFDQWKEWLNPG